MNLDVALRTLTQPVDEEDLDMDTIQPLQEIDSQQDHLNQHPHLRPLPFSWNPYKNPPSSIVFDSKPLNLITLDRKVIIEKINTLITETETYLESLFLSLIKSNIFKETPFDSKEFILELVNNAELVNDQIEISTDVYHLRPDPQILRRRSILMQLIQQKLIDVFPLFFDLTTLSIPQPKIKMDLIPLFNPNLVLSLTWKRYDTSVIMNETRNPIYFFPEEPEWIFIVKVKLNVHPNPITTRMVFRSNLKFVLFDTENTQDLLLKHPFNLNLVTHSGSVWRGFEANFLKQMFSTEINFFSIGFLIPPYSTLRSIPIQTALVNLNLESIFDQSQIFNFRTVPSLFKAKIVRFKVTS